MKNKKITYLLLVAFHILLGIVFFLVPKTGIPYGILMLFFSFLLIFNTQNNKNQVLYVAAYAVGSEAILRMTGSYILYEIGKYSVVVYMIMGMYFSGFSKNSFPYWIFLMLLIPGILISSETLNLETSIRKAMAFNISGPICLGVSAIYCYQRNITLKELDTVLLTMFLPIITTVTYLFLYAPSVREVVTNTESNFKTSGGFGPNQVSTVIGLGVFIVFTRLVFHSKSKIVWVLNAFLLLIFTFRGIVTFSRGGMICALLMTILLITVLFKVTKRSAKSKLIVLILISGISLSGIWLYSTDQTGGLINKRYSNQDAAGRVKASKFSGREDIVQKEFNMFLDNPFFGVGVGKGKENRQDADGADATSATHNEISRMLAEHGSLGIMALIILFFTPIILFVNNRKHIYLLSFVTFWLLTINHAAMRLAAPAFVYALSLLHIYTVDEPEKPSINTVN